MDGLNTHQFKNNLYNNHLKESEIITLGNPPTHPAHPSINDNYFENDERKVKKVKTSHRPNVEMQKKKIVYRHHYLEDYLGISELAMIILDYCASSECAKAASPELRKMWYERNIQVFTNINHFFHQNQITSFDFFIENIENWAIQISQYSRTLALLSGRGYEEWNYEDLDIAHLIPFFEMTEMAEIFKENAKKMDQDLWSTFNEIFNNVPDFENFEGDEDFTDYYERISDSTEDWIKACNARWWLDDSKISRFIKCVTCLEPSVQTRLSLIPIEIRKLPYLQLIDLRGNNLSQISLNLKEDQQIFQPLKVNIHQIKQHPSHIEGEEPEVGNLLRCLNLSINSFATFPSEICNLVNLRSLLLKQNQLRSIPGSISKLIYLTELDLSNNLLKELPMEIGELISLNKFEANSNYIETLPYTIGKLSNLKILYLDKNELISIPNTISDLTSLVDLSLNLNHLISLPRELGDLTQLQNLSLILNRLESLPNEIENLINLKKFSIKGNNNLKIPISLKKLIKKGCALDIPPKVLKKLYIKEQKQNCCVLQ